MKLEILTKIKESIVLWYYVNFYQISWFIIGFMACEGIMYLAKDDGVMATISFAIAAINYWFAREEDLGE